MALFLLMTWFAFWIPESKSKARIALIALGIYLYTDESPPLLPFSATVARIRQHVEDILHEPSAMF